jgi:hypothetical protein
MSGPEPRWPDPTRPEKSAGRGRSVLNVRGLIVVVVAATALVALTGVFLGSGSENGGPSSSSPPLPGPSLRALVESVPPRAFRDPASRRRLIRDSQEVSATAEDGFVAAANRQLARMRRHVDGCDSEVGTADADDWVVDCVHQLRLRSAIDRSMEDLRR